MFSGIACPSRKPVKHGIIELETCNLFVNGKKLSVNIPVQVMLPPSAASMECDACYDMRKEKCNKGRSSLSDMDTRM